MLRALRSYSHHRATEIVCVCHNIKRRRRYGSPLCRASCTAKYSHLTRCVGAHRLWSVARVSLSHFAPHTHSLTRAPAKPARPVCLCVCVSLGVRVSVHSASSARATVARRHFAHIVTRIQTHAYTHTHPAAAAAAKRARTVTHKFTVAYITYIYISCVCSQHTHIYVPQA